MAAIRNKIDFAVAVYVEGANPNGDPLNGNRPRTTVNGLGEMSDVCIKRKIRNRLQDEGQKIFVQSEDRADDGMKSLHDRVKKIINEAGTDRDKIISLACAEWFDVRAFGQVFPFKGKKKNKEDKEDKEGGADGVSIGIRGPVSIRTAMSVAPVNITSTQITKSVNLETEAEGKKGSDRIGMKYRVDCGMYLIRGSINPQLAAKTGFSDDDAEILKNALKTLFVNDCSSARPDGSMDVVKMIWWKHNCPIGQYSSAVVHNSIKINAKCDDPQCVDDFEIVVAPLDGLNTEEL